MAPTDTTQKAQLPAIIFSAIKYVILPVGDKLSQHANPNFIIDFSDIAMNRELLVALNLPTEFLDYYERRHCGPSPANGLAVYIADMKSITEPQARKTLYDYLPGSKVEILPLDPQLKADITACLN